MSHWGYSNHNGPHTWALDCKIAAGTRQSPIIIDKGTSVKDSNLKPLKIDVAQYKNQVLCNSGHGFRVDMTNPEKGELSGGPLQSKYRLVQFHCHWGKTSRYGSEHILEGQIYPAELHLVFYNETYGSFAEALNHNDGLAVLGVFIQVGRTNEALAGLVHHLRDVKYNGDKVELADHVDIEKLLPHNRNYYTYLGSLTTPPCSECVTWIVFENHIEVSEEQIGKFRHIHEGKADSDVVVDNFRPPCPLGNRELKRSF